MEIAGADLVSQYEQARRLWPFLIDVERAHGLPPLLLFALGSRETGLQRRYAEGQVHDDGTGWGLFGADQAWNDLDLPAFASDPRAQATLAASTLAANYAAEGSWLDAVNAYGPEWARPLYGADVLDRRQFLVDREAEPVDDEPPAELDPLGANQGVHAVDVPRELAPLRPAILPPRSNHSWLLGGLARAAAAVTGTVERALAFLESQLGLAEYPPGSNANWLTDWYFGWHVAWCAITMSRALIESGFGTSDQIDFGPFADSPGLRTTSAKGWAYCPYLEADFRAAGLWHTSGPEPGDLVLYDWDGDGWADHVGMLQRVGDDGTLWVYEGNTDEGVLRLKHRSLTYVRGYARPPYAPAPVEPRPTTTAQEDDDMRIINVTDRGIFLVSAGEPDHINTPDQVIELATVGIPYQADKELPATTFDRFFPEAPAGVGAAGYAALVAEVRDRLVVSNG